MSGPYRVYRVDEWYWWLARSLEEAIESCVQFQLEFGPSEEEIREGIKDYGPRELTIEDLRSANFHEEDGSVHSMLEEYARVLYATPVDQLKPQIFACAEY